MVTLSIIEIFLGGGLRATGNHYAMLALLHNFAALVDQFDGNDDNAPPWATVRFAHAFDVKLDVAGITNLDRRHKAPLPAERHSRLETVVTLGLEAIRDRQAKQSVRNAGAKRGFFGIFLIDRHWRKVPRQFGIGVDTLR